MLNEDVVSLWCPSVLQQTRALPVITENCAAAVGGAGVDLVALGTYFQALPLENDVFRFARGLPARKQARGLGMLKPVSCDFGSPA